MSPNKSQMTQPAPARDCRFQGPSPSPASASSHPSGTSGTPTRAESSQEPHPCDGTIKNLAALILDGLQGPDCPSATHPLCTSPWPWVARGGSWTR
ncbi:hypothetical protein PAPYR_9291 [Paratrimastix pyriformis]|uniref:Uncharacterized protein n=1 Tax=Paratrimastix pyriformis TaxID=342808 RepID=A0ABQ8UBG9_9EUKA|nr:hypothetical protein PAPYR_9291 [Paratrimastix pyriformis]